MTFFMVISKSNRNPNSRKTNPYSETVHYQESVSYIPKIKFPLFSNVNSSLIAMGSVLFQLKEDSKIDVIAYDSQPFATIGPN